MKTKTVLGGNDNNILNVRLESILSEIKDSMMIEDIKWSILWIEGVTNDSDFNILELEEKINNSKNGIRYSFDELNTLANRMDQIINLLIIADFDEMTLKRYESDIQMYQGCKITIELVDSSYWEVHHDDSIKIKK